MKEGGSSSSSSIRISSGKKLITIGKKITSGSTSKGSTKQGDPLSITVDQDTDKLAQENLWSGSLLGVCFNGNNMMINNNSRFFLDYNPLPSVRTITKRRTMNIIWFMHDNDG